MNDPKNMNRSADPKIAELMSLRMKTSTLASLLLISACAQSYEPDASPAPDSSPTIDASADTLVADSTPLDTDGMTVICGDCLGPDGYYVGANLCTNESDLSAIDRADYGEAGDQSIDDLAEHCRLDCISDPHFVDCSSSCLHSASATALSLLCANCYSAHAACVFTNCAAECLSDRDGLACERCRNGDNSCCLDCEQVFDDCSGITRSDG